MCVCQRLLTATSYVHAHNTNKLGLCPCNHDQPAGIPVDGHQGKNHAQTFPVVTSRETNMASDRTAKPSPQNANHNIDIPRDAITAGQLEMRRGWRTTVMDTWRKRSPASIQEETDSFRTRTRALFKSLQTSVLSAAPATTLGTSLGFSFYPTTI